MNQDLDIKKQQILTELYSTGRCNGLYMGKPSKSKKPPHALKAYIRQWLVSKGIRLNIDNMVEDFFIEFFAYIGKMEADRLVALAENPTKFTASMCVIVQRQLMKVDDKQVVKGVRELLAEHLDINKKSVDDYVVEYVRENGTFTSNEFKDINLKNLNEYLLEACDVAHYLISYYTYLKQVNKLNPNASYFEKLKHNSQINNTYGSELGEASEKEEKADNNFQRQHGVSINDIMQEMTEQELAEFKLLANRKGKVTKANKQYWDDVETRVYNSVNRIKFKLK